MKTKIKSFICIFIITFSSLYTKAEEPLIPIELVACFLNSSNTETVTSRIDVGLQPLKLAVNPVTRKLYVTNFASDTVSVIDTETNFLLSTINTGKAPNGISVNSKINKIYVGNQLDNTVTVIDGSTDTVTTTISVGQKPVHILANENTNKIYVSNQDSNSVSIIDSSNDAVTTEISVGIKPQGIGINTKTNKIYIANTESNNISIIDGSSNTVIKTIENIITNPTGIAIDESKNTIYVFSTSGESLLGRGILYIINGSSDTVARSIIIGSFGSEIAFHKASDKVYITHTFNSTIDGYNTKQDELLCTITEIFDPVGIAIDPKSNLIYICETSTSKVAVVKDTGIKKDDDNKPDKPEKPEDNNTNGLNTNPELVNDFNQAVEELTNIQNEIKNSSRFARPVATRIGSAIRKLKKAIKFSQSICENQTQISIEKFEAVIPFFESKGCSETKSRRCIPVDILDDLLTQYEDQIEIIRSVTETDDNANNVPDLCER